jgi:response regulator RpfG family c-di-GMP phosphodiesterase
MDTIAWDKVQSAPSGSIYRIAPTELKLGHKIIGLDIDWDETPWRGPSMVLDDLATKAYLKKHCAWVVIDLKSGTNKFRPSARWLEPLSEPLPPLPERVDALQRSALSAQSLKNGAALYAQLYRRVHEFATNFQKGTNIDAGEAIDFAHRLADGIEESLAALMWLSRIKDSRLYLTQHLIHTTLLMAGFVHALGWERERVETAALVGLLHDLGKLRLDRNLLLKSGPLSEGELKSLRSHPTVAAELLRQNPDVPWEVIAGVAASHEQPDGLGYPRGLKGDAIPVMARLIAIIDAYDAMTSKRVHGKLMTHQQALGQLWKERGSQFSADIVERFIQFLGWVTPGTLVRLTDQRLAVVMEMRHEGGVRPVVRPLTQTAGGLRMGGELVLRPQVGGSAHETLAIAELLPDSSADTNPRELTEQLFAVLGESAEQMPAPEHLPEWNPSEQPVDIEDEPIEPEPDESETEAELDLSRPSRQQPPSVADGLRILIIDDSLTIRRTIQQYLEQAGGEVVTAVSGEAGLKEVKHALPDLIFLDILLPGMSGFSVLRQIRRISGDRKIPVVMISGNPQATEQFFLDRIGADDFLPKPFARKDVMACLQRLLDQGKVSRSTDRESALR